MNNWYGYTNATTTVDWVNNATTSHYAKWPNYPQQTAVPQLNQSAPVVPPPRPPAPKPDPDPKPTVVDRVKAWFRGPDAYAAIDALPKLAGASPEAETKIKTVHKKTVMIEQLVGPTREKNGTEQELHAGTLELVRTMEGPDHLTRTIGVKVHPKNGSSFVEVPMESLREALGELDLPADSNKASDAGKTDA